MQTDERTVRYMKARNDQARITACAAAVQFFALAVYFCLYALIACGVFYSLSEKTGKAVTIAICAVITVGVAVLDILTVIRSDKVNITRPDSIAMRESEEVVRLAYSTARPVLIYKITYCAVICTISAIVYIILLIIMEDQALANIYGKTGCCLALAVSVLIAYPCIDRIACYRALLGETHELMYERNRAKAAGFVAAVTVPGTIFAWYVLRYFGPRPSLAWVVFPFTALFAIAVPFLISWAKESTVTG